MKGRLFYHKANETIKTNNEDTGRCIGTGTRHILFCSTLADSDVGASIPGGP